MSAPDFYTALADHYDELFGTSEDGLALLRSVAGATSGRILDVACGTGAWLRQLVQNGLDVNGVDLSSRMIERGKALATEAGVDPARLRVGDMMLIDHHARAPFGLVYCLGNSVAHLASESAVAMFLQAAARAVGPAGAVVLQYVSVDGLAVGERMVLPALSSGDVTMERTYRRISPGEIEFIATLSGSNLQQQTVTQRLLVMRDEDVRAALTDAGFSSIEVNGGFARSPVTSDSWVRVVVARR